MIHPWREAILFKWERSVCRRSHSVYWRQEVYWCAWCFSLVHTRGLRPMVSNWKLAYVGTLMLVFLFGVSEWYVQVCAIECNGS
jgi:hypothetical protein